MHIAVCVKQIPNPDALAAVLRVDEAAKAAVLPPGHPLVMSPFDEQALEAALRIRDKAGAGVRISAITLGPESARAVLKHALSLGADDGVHLLDPAFEGSDGYAVARALAAAITKLGEVDLVLCGRQAADWDAGIVGLGIAELLDRASVSFACDIEAVEGAVRVERVLQDGFEVVEAPLPALVTVSNELGEPRKANLRETMRAARKPVAVYTAADLGLGGDAVGRSGSRRALERLYIPEKSGQCEIVEGASAAEAGARLVEKLREARVL